MAKGSIKDLMEKMKGDVKNLGKGFGEGYYEDRRIYGTPGATARRWMPGTPPSEEEPTPTPTRMSTRSSEPPVATPEDMILPEIETTELLPVLQPGEPLPRVSTQSQLFDLLEGIRRNKFDQMVTDAVMGAPKTNRTVGSRGRVQRRG